MRIASLLIVLGACQGGSEQRPINPGGGDDHVTPPLTDAGTTTTDGTTSDGAGISGRVCVVSDLRNLSTCAATGAAGLTVTLGSETATTSADGSFTIPTPAGSSLVWHVSGTSIVSSVMAYSTSALVPAVPATVYDNLTLSNGVIVNAGEGSVIGRVVRAATVVSGATATISPSATYAAFYDGNSASTWNQNSTGTRGVFWIPGAGAGSASLIVDTAAGDTVAATADVESDSITFLVVEVP